MPFDTLTASFPWNRYSRKLSVKMENPRSFGFMTLEEAEARAMRLVDVSEGSIDDGNLIRIFWLVDKDDGVIVDCKYQAFGQTALIGAAEVVCELLLGKNYDQAKRISTELIDKQVRDRSDEPAFPRETYPHLNLILEAVERGAETCMDLPLASNYVAPPVPMDIGEVLQGGYPGWKELSLEQKKSVIEQVLDQDVRPYIALDAGGVRLLDFVNDRDVLIAYEGSCTSCYSSIGTTLSFIQQVIRAKVFPDLVVVPELGENFMR